MKRLRRAPRAAVERLRSWTPSVIQLAGMGAFSFGWFLVATPVGFIVTGVLVMAVGWALDGSR